jgi:hypothetical protein
MRVLAGAGAGFLLAVLWFDLMFDVQARGHGREIPADVRASIAAYYARVTTAARPMNRLVAAAMSSTIVATGADDPGGTHRLFRRDRSRSRPAARARVSRRRCPRCPKSCDIAGCELMRNAQPV